jgi:DNA-binding CsgD family transcriptional regulator
VPGAPALSRREREVLCQLASSHSYREIAQKLGVSEETIRTHVKSVLRKLGQPDRTQAVLAGVRLGLLRLT